MMNDNGVVTSPTLLQDLGDPDRRDEAWRTFLERYRPLIHGWCGRSGLNAGDAEEVSAAVLAKLVRAMRTFVYDPARRFRGWLRTVVDHEVCSLWRQRARRPGDYGSGAPGVHKELEAVRAPAAVEDLVRELDETLERDLERARQVTARVRQRVGPNTWEAFWRTAIDKEPAGDVAGRLGLTVAAVYMAKRRVGCMLREEGARLLDAEARKG